MESMESKTTRRNFLQLSTIGMAGALFLPGLKAFPNILTGNQKRMGIALVGLGYYSADILARHFKLPKQLIWPA
jgi:hypothetical protein